MIELKIATKADEAVLALLGRLTWAESHGPYIEDKNDVAKYLAKNFSISKTRENLNDPNQLYCIIYADALPVGYAKLIINASNNVVTAANGCQLERIFILNDFIPLKIGHQLLHFVEEQAKKLQRETLWLTVYIKNNRAIRFYERNEFKNVGNVNFVVNGKEYENIVFSKKI